MPFCTKVLLFCSMNAATRKNHFSFFVFSFSLLFASCTVQQRIGRSAKNIAGSAALKSAHLGIAVYNPDKQKLLYGYNSDKYFVPASNTKIATCYAAIKYLGKNLPGIKYRVAEDEVYLYPTGDPTFLHPNFDRQRVFLFLKNIDKTIFLNETAWQETALGSGWAWNDYAESYMPERSALPIYGNVLRIGGEKDNLEVVPRFFQGNVAVDSSTVQHNYPAAVKRSLAGNEFTLQLGTKPLTTTTPFYTNNGKLNHLLLQDALRKPVKRDTVQHRFGNDTLATIRSMPTDSLLKPMMHRSDNFFAEQSLLMVSNAVLNRFNDAAIIDTLLKTDLASLPQKPRWADGSGLSRYNLFTPQSFVHLLHKIRDEAGMERVKEIFATGGEGTLAGYYAADSNYLFAKTGTLSGVVALSGYLYTKKNKLLLFSVLVNNHNGSATAVRREVEKFVQGLRRKN